MKSPPVLKWDKKCPYSLGHHLADVNQKHVHRDQGEGGRESIRVLGTLPVWLTEMSSCVAPQSTEPPLPKWPGVHLLASSITESTIPLSALCCTAQDSFWAYQRPVSTKLSLANLRYHFFFSSWFGLSTPFSRYVLLQLFELCSYKGKTSETLPCMSFHWS